ncbi:MAG: hypothetical protein IJ137_12000 [Eubacterium sp.]|nr:hypothetical protein [Eubacterium sp.]
MQYCPKCKIHIRGDKRCCPLCEGSIEGNPDNPAFPTLKKRRYPIRLMFKICLFLFVIVEVVSMMIHIMTGFRFHLPVLFMMWAPFVLLDLCVALYYRGNIIKLISYQAYAVMAVCAFIDYGDGKMGWSLNWIIPATLLSLTIVTIIIGYGVGLRLVDYMIYLLVDVILAVLQLIPVLLGINRVPYMAIASVGIMLVVAAFVVIFRPRELGNAFSKYMNM